MSDWLHNLPVPVMALSIFAFTYLLAIIIFAAVAALATGERAKSFQAISPGMLPVLGIIFGLFVAFTAAQVWNDNDRASAAVSREASALRAIVLLAAGLPPEQEGRVRNLVRGYIEQIAKVEWPMMAGQTASLRPAPPALTEALQLVVSMSPQGAGQQTAQREIINALGTALDARRQRIIISQAEVNPVKWWSLYLQAICELFVIALVHCGNRLASGIAMALFATGVAASVLLIAATTGHLPVKFRSDRSRFCRSCRMRRRAGERCSLRAGDQTRPGVPRSPGLVIKQPLDIGVMTEVHPPAVRERFIGNVA